MLDSLRTEEVKRLRSAVARCFGVDAEDKSKVEAVDAKLKSKIKGNFFGVVQYVIFHLEELTDLILMFLAYDNVTQHTFVEQVFGGQLLQIIKCLKCRNISKRHEPFLDLSLSIVDAKVKFFLLRSEWRC